MLLSEPPGISSVLVKGVPFPANLWRLTMYLSKSSEPKIYRSLLDTSMNLREVRELPQNSYGFISEERVYDFYQILKGVYD